jgi:excisionase family DNA binding protein
MEKLLFRPEEVSEMLSLGRTTIYSAIRDGRLESVKVGASRRVTVEALDRFIESLRIDRAPKGSSSRSQA